MFLKNRNISSKIEISKVTDYAALKQRNTMFLKSITCDPSLYTTDPPDFIVSSLKEHSIDPKMVNPEPE